MLSPQYPRSPYLVKGALIAYDVDALIPVPTVIPFQYNPDELSRSFTQQQRGAEGEEEGKKAKEKAPTVAGLPIETISLKVEIDATDQLEVKNPVASTLGIHPTLSALEMLMMPALRRLEEKKGLAMAGSIGVDPTRLPLVLFVWGPTRVLPVQVTDLSIHESGFDTFLNPIRAEVGLTMKVLTYEDLKDSSMGAMVSLALQARREVLARTNLIAQPPQFFSLP